MAEMLFLDDDSGDETRFELLAIEPKRACCDVLTGLHTSPPTPERLGRGGGRPCCRPLIRLMGPTV